MQLTEKEKGLARVRAMLRGRKVAGPVQTTGGDVRRLLEVPGNRMLALRPAHGDTVRQVGNREVLDLGPGDEFTDFPVGGWGYDHVRAA